MRMGVVSIEAGNDMLINIPAPLSKRADPAVPTVMSGGSMTAYALDMEAATQLTAEAPGASDSFTVASSAGFAVGDFIHLRLDNGTIFEGEIDAIPDANTIETSTATGVSFATAAARSLYKRLGLKITGSEYGSAPAVDTIDWGYKAIIEATHAPEFSTLTRFLAEANIIKNSDNITRTWEVRLVR